MDCFERKSFETKTVKLKLLFEGESFKGGPSCPRAQ
jgi:hypothetical protein